MDKEYSAKVRFFVANIIAENTTYEEVIKKYPTLKDEIDECLAEINSNNN